MATSTQFYITAGNIYIYVLHTFFSWNDVVIEGVVGKAGGKKQVRFGKMAMPF